MRPPHPAHLLFAAGLLTASLSPAAHADVVVVAPKDNTAGSFTITSPMTFTLNTAGDVSEIVFDEWVTSDGKTDFAAYSPGLSLSVNGGGAGLLGTLRRSRRATAARA